MSFLTCSMFVAIVCVLSQTAEAQTVNPSILTEMYPYVSVLGYERPSYLSTTTDEQLLAIASQYNMKPGHIYELYSMLNQYSALTIDQDLRILDRVAAAMEKERLRRGIMYPSYKYYNNFIPTRPATRALLRRNPQVISGLINDVASNINSAYQNLKDYGSYYFPNLSRGLSNEIRDITSTEIPTTVANDARDLGNKLTRSLGNMLYDLF